MNGQLFVVVGFLVVMLGIRYTIFYRTRRREVGHKAAVRDLFRGFVHLVGIGVIIIVFFGLFRLFPASWKDRALAVFYLLCHAGMSAYFITWLWRKRLAGAVLLDLGRSTHPHYKMMLVGVGAMILIAVSRLVEPGHEIEIWSFLKDVFLILCWLSLGAFLLVGSKSFEIRETGIFYFGLSLRWERIKSYEWEGEKSHTFTVKVGRRLSFFRTLRLPIPSAHKDSVDSLLAKYVSGATTESRNGT